MNWSGLGSGVNGPVRALAVLPNGNLVAAGWFTTAGGVVVNRIARWNGSSWSQMGGGMNGAVNALAVLGNGDVVAGGNFTTAGGVAANYIARWNGSMWAPLGAGLNFNVTSVAARPDGGLLAVVANSVFLWNGTSWSQLGAGMDNTVSTMTTLPNGDVIAGGFFTNAGGVPANRIARWGGSSWSPVGSGMDDYVSSLAVWPSGALVAAGGFLTAGGSVSAYVARLTASCPATASSAGASCASSGGANTYAAVNLPWTGSIYRTRGTGLPSFAFVAVLNGFSATSIPLAAVLPPSPVGCSLLASPDVVDAVLTTTGTVDAQVALPNTPSLAGVVLHQQLVALEIDANLNLVQNTSTNALTATIGVF